MPGTHRSRRGRAALLLDAGADLIEAHGWKRGGTGTPETGFGAHEAVAYVMYGDRGASPLVYRMAMQKISDCVNWNFQVADSRSFERVVKIWNDTVATGQGQVVQVMRLAAGRTRDGF